eukprot:gene14590-biopygen10471
MADLIAEDAVDHHLRRPGSDTAAREDIPRYCSHFSPEDGDRSIGGGTVARACHAGAEGAMVLKGRTPMIQCELNGGNGLPLADQPGPQSPPTPHPLAS